MYCGIDSVPASLVSHESWQGLIRAQNPPKADRLLFTSVLIPYKMVSFTTVAMLFHVQRQTLPAGQYVTDEDMRYVVDCIREAIVK